MSDGIFKIGIGLFLIAHGLIHASYASPAPPPKPGAPEWPFVLTRSWLLTPMGLDAKTTRWIGTVLWILTVCGYVLAGLGFLGVPVLQNGWQLLTVAASIISLGLLIVFWHAWISLGILIDIALFVWVLKG
ncbi:MAG: hypothetical protein HY868_09010 [Chloroflexi bacterium]|nr:hypothetical protein [Chloroflexota bacterium]